MSDEKKKKKKFDEQGLASASIPSPDAAKKKKKKKKDSERASAREAQVSVTPEPVSPPAQAAAVPATTTAPAAESEPAPTAAPAPAPAPAAAPGAVAQPQGEAPVQWQPAPERSRNGGFIAGIVALSVANVAALTAVALLLTGIVTSPFAGDAAGASPATTGTPTTTFLAPAAAMGASAFSSVPRTSPLAGDVAQAAIGPVSSDLVPANVKAVSGDADGTYGQGVGVCSRNTLGAEIVADPARATAFVTALNTDADLVWPNSTVPADQIEKYLMQLTTVQLASDTLVTYHTFDGATSAATPAVLQKGTIVLVDRLGVPRVRCISGNPLTVADTSILPTYQGEGWPDFDPASVIAVEPAAALVSGMTVRVPATVTGVLAPLSMATCDSFAGTCQDPGPDYTAAAVSNDGSGIPVPTAPVCGTATSTSPTVNVRIWNTSTETRQVFWVDDACNVTWWGWMDAGQNYSWGTFDFEQRDRQIPQGDVFIMTNGQNTDVLATLNATQPNNLTVVP